MATRSSVLAWRIPGMGEPGGLRSMGSHRVGHDWSDLAVVAAGVYVFCVFSFMVSFLPRNWQSYANMFPKSPNLWTKMVIIFSNISTQGCRVRPIFFVLFTYLFLLECVLSTNHAISTEIQLEWEMVAALLLGLIKPFSPGGLGIFMEPNSFLGLLI